MDKNFLYMQEKVYLLCETQMTSLACIATLSEEENI